MASRGELERMRAEAVRAHRAATRKISRAKRNFNAALSGSEVDPRRDLKRVRRYTRAQLQVYTDELKSFTDRSNQFVGLGRKGTPVPKVLFDKYKLTEQQYNSLMRADFKNVAHLMTPDNDMTIEAFNELRKTLHPRMHNPASNAYRKVDRSPDRIKDLKALEKLQRDLEKKMTPEHRARLEKINRQTASDMLDTIGGVGSDKVKARLDKLTSGQFRLLWNEGGKFANELSTLYELYKTMLSSRDEMTENSAFNTFRGDSENELEKVLSWVEKQNV